MACDELWLIRHGETEWSRDGRHTSTTDLPLTDDGRRVAEGLSDRLDDDDFSLVLTSPRLRARETARLAGHPEATVDDDLAEWDYGDLEGETTPEIRETLPDWTIWDGPVPGRGRTRVICAGGSAGGVCTPSGSRACLPSAPAAPSPRSSRTSSS